MLLAVLQDQGDDAAETGGAELLRDVLHCGQELAAVGGKVVPFARIAGTVHARRPAKRINLQAGVVREAGGVCDIENMFRL